MYIFIQRVNVFLMKKKIIYIYFKENKLSTCLEKKIPRAKKFFTSTQICNHLRLRKDITTNLKLFYGVTISDIVQYSVHHVCLFNNQLVEFF